VDNAGILYPFSFTTGQVVGMIISPPGGVFMIYQLATHRDKLIKRGPKAGSGRCLSVQPQLIKQPPVRRL